MKERPILFSAAMVRVILAGTKTQTRRILSPANGEQRKWLTRAAIGNVQRVEVCRAQFDEPTSPLGVQLEHPRGGPLGFVTCPYGEPGDRLWVRETWACHADENRYYDPKKPWSASLFYAADGFFRQGDTDDGSWVLAEDQHVNGWRPSIFMPRWASRITLEITDVRVERLQAISEADAIDEGVHHVWCGAKKLSHVGCCDNRAAYQKLWDSINEKRAPWSSNPWVWAVSFKRVTA